MRKFDCRRLEFEATAKKARAKPKPREGCPPKRRGGRYKGKGNGNGNGYGYGYGYGYGKTYKGNGKAEKSGLTRRRCG